MVAQPETPEQAKQRRATLWAMIFYAVGLVGRYFYIFYWHRMPDHIYSDMEGYMNAIKSNFFDPTYVPGIVDTIYPPGTMYFFGALRLLDPSLSLAMSVQFILSAAVPLLIAAIGRQLFGWRTAICALGFSSLYFPIIDYFGYLLSEGPFTILTLLSFWLLIASIQSTQRWKQLGAGCAAGMTLGLAISFKSVALPVAAAIAVVLLIAKWKRSLPAGRPLLGAAVGLLVVLVPLSIRATQLNEGRFCLVANELARGILIGHSEFGSITFQDSERNWTHVYGCSAAIQRGYTIDATFPVGVYENKKVIQLAIDQFKAHPMKTILLSCWNVFDVVFALPWPSYDVLTLRPWVKLFRIVFIVFVFLPASVQAIRRARDMLRLKPEAFGILLMCVPILVLFVSAFVAAGEPRYRIPFEGFLILLAARQCTGDKTFWSWLPNQDSLRSS